MTIRVSAFTSAFVITAFLILIILSPSVRIIDYIYFHDYQRVIQLILLSLILFDGMLSQQNLVPINKKIHMALFIVMFLALISAWRAIETRFSIIEITVFTALCYLALFVHRLYTRDKEIFVKKLSYAIIAGVVLNLFAFYIGYLSAMISGRGLTWPEPLVGFSSVRIFNQYQLLTLAITCLPILAFGLKNNVRTWLYIVLGTWYGLLFYAASRGAILSWGLAMAVTAVVYKKQAWPFLRIQLIAAISGLLNYIVFFKLIPMWIMPTSAIMNISTIFRDTITDRLNLWKMAYVMVKNFPIFGVGPMHFYFYNSFGTHPHNSVLQIAAEWGLPATIIILTIITYAARCWFKQFGPIQLPNNNNLNQQLAIILFFTMTMNGAYSLVDGVIVMPISQVLIFTMIGLMIGQYTEGSGFVNNQEPQKKFYSRRILAGVTLLLLVFSTMPELVRGLASESRALQPGEMAFSMAPNTTNPRIWMQQRRTESTQ